MGALLCLTPALQVPPANDPTRPLVVLTRKDHYFAKDTLSVVVQNRADVPLSVRDAMPVDRANGDGTWTRTFQLRVADACPPGDARQVPVGKACITLPPRSALRLPEWNFYEGGDEQCPLRAPGARTFKGILRFTVEPCEGTPALPGTRLITWE